MLETMLLLSAAVTAFTEFAKSTLAQFSFFTGLNEEAQSIVLQVIAFAAGVIAAIAGNVNIFPAAPLWLGLVGTGLIAGTGSSAIHTILALLGIRPGVSAEMRAAAVKAQADTGSRRTFAPFM